MDRIQLIVLKGKVLAMENALMTKTLPAEAIRSEAARLLKEAGGVIDMTLWKRLQTMAQEASSSASDL